MNNWTREAVINDVERICKQCLDEIAKKPDTSCHNYDYLAGMNIGVAFCMDDKDISAIINRTLAEIRAIDEKKAVRMQIKEQAYILSSIKETCDRYVCVAQSNIQKYEPDFAVALLDIATERLTTLKETLGIFLWYTGELGEIIDHSLTLINVLKYKVAVVKMIPEI